MKKPLSAYSLKMIGVGTMLADHLNYFLPSIFPLWLRYFGRMAAPTFLFLSVESYFKTKNRRKFFLRLGLAAAIVEIGDLLAEAAAKKYFLPYGSFYEIGVNIFIIIFLALLVYYSLERFTLAKMWMEKIMWLVIIIFLGLSMSLYQDGFLCIGLVLIFYFTRHHREKILPVIFIAYSLLYLIWAVVSGHNYWTNDFQWMMVLTVPLFILYSGQRGKKNKYFFYLFYPIHRWILYFIGCYLLR